MLEELIHVRNFYYAIKDDMAKMSQAAFETCICMLLEEYCREHDLNIVSEINSLIDVICMVNEELGKY